jgi:mannose-6-phosphate isomerase
MSARKAILRPLALKNTIQTYAWGSHTAIQQLMGKPPTDVPWAELWIGAHPKAPSMVAVSGQWASLDALIQRFPDEILGKTTAVRFDNMLPFLFKILAADQPLSIQAHPDREQAKAGFARENTLDIPMDDPSRNYRDPFHKPECICALTPFTALKGFRDMDEILGFFSQLIPEGMKQLSRQAASAPSASGNQAPETCRKSSSIKQFYQPLLDLPPDIKNSLLAEAVENAKKAPAVNEVFSWVLRLHHDYPDDIGILCPAMMHLVTLSPGQALFLEAGELHAYLRGMGIEIMANSDNVLRGGLTVKHMDTAELLCVGRFNPDPPHILKPDPISAMEFRYPVFAEEFVLSVIHMVHGDIYLASENRSVEILLCTEGTARLTHPDLHDAIMLKPGESALIPAAADPYHLEGPARVYKAAVPI